MSYGNVGWLKKNKIRNIIIASVIIIVLAAAFIFLWFEYQITTVTVTGNSHYTDEEIEKIVFDKAYTYNSIILKIKYHNKSVENIPFVEKMDVDIVNPHTVRINVYEKAIAGYVEYLGHFMYFDKDGIVVESSEDKIEGVPFVTGLSFDYVVLHEQLPVRDPKVFLLILNITQLLNKYEIETDRIAFDSSGDITLYFGNARISLGNEDYIDEKINEMHLLLPKLEGYSGTLHMENYSGEEGSFSFDKDEEIDEAEEMTEEGEEDPDAVSENTEADIEDNDTAE